MLFHFPRKTEGKGSNEVRILVLREKIEKHRVHLVDTDPRLGAFRLRI
jgi:hypothetical protein